MTQSDTPRTDEELWHTIPRVTNEGCVSANFARQLERELAKRKDAVVPSEAQVDALIAFAKDSSYLSHPKVRPWRGTGNGDTQEKWERDYFTEMARAMFTARAEEGKG